MSSRRRLRDDSGFTLVEILIALGILAVVMVAALPALIAVAKTSVVTRDHTSAKNLAQLRMEQIRDLRYHVDRQNGPFLDLLDLYYTHATVGAPATSINAGGSTLTGTYVAAGSPAVAGEPTAPYFRVTTGPLPGNPGFSQVVTTQFLDPTGAVVPASRFQGVVGPPATGYDSQTAGRDEPPSLYVEVTVTTLWQQAGAAKSFVTRTRISDGQPERPLIQSQARAVGLDVSSTAADGTTVKLQGGVVSIDGAQSNGSSVAGHATGAVATRSGVAAVSGLQRSFNLPGTPVTTTGSGSANLGTSCGWFAFGPTSTTNVTGDVSTGLPKAPADVDGTPYRTLGSSINANGNHSCGAVSFDNLVGGGIGKGPADPLGPEMGAAPYVRVSDTSGSAEVIGARGYVTSNLLTSTTQRTASGARTSVVQPVVVFPSANGGQGLVSVSLTTAQVDCISGTSSINGSVTGSYSGLVLRWWGQGPADTAARWHTATWSYTGTGLPALASGSDIWAPDSTVVAPGVVLSQLVQVNIPSATSGVLVEGLTSGQRGFPGGILSLTTAPTLVNEVGPGFSAIKIQVGQLSCVAVDER